MHESTNESGRSAGTGNNHAAFVARRPIYTRSGGLFAYELLYRYDGSATIAENDERSAAEKFLKTFLDVGLEAIVGDSRAFIRIPRPFILRDHCTALPNDKVVLEVSPDIEAIQADQTVIPSLRALKDLGYKLALDDFDYSEELRPMLDLADYASVNLKRVPREQAYRQLITLKTSSAKIIASQIDSHEAFDNARSMGFEYFRGKCFNQPKLATAPRIPLNRLSTLQLVLKLQEPELSAAELERIVGYDLVISYKLLQFVNSAALSLSKTIESIGHAIRMVGTERIRAWASLLLMSKFDDKPRELVTTAFVRGKMAENLAVMLGSKTPASYHMVGLFSVVDTLLNVPMPEAIQLLPFSRQVREALVHHEGPMGSVLGCVLAYEDGTWKDVRCGQLDEEAIRQCYLDALAAARKMPKVK